VHVFGLTGGFASGKSAVTGHWARRGLPIIDADRLSRDVVEPGTPGLSAVVNEFGSEVLASDGRLDRSRLGALVFSDPERRKRLEALLHPLIQQKMQADADALARQGEPLACYVAPVLLEAGSGSRFKPLVVVTADEAQQIARGVARDGLDEAAVRARLRAQMPLAEKAAAADYVIDNSGTLEASEQQADAVLSSICRAFGVDEARYGLVAPPPAGGD
jgi:dephospho-CoA kinase